MKSYRIGEYKELMVDICQALSEKGFVSSMDGNVSAKIDDDCYLVTPSMINKRFIRETDLIIVDSNGLKISGSENRTPTSEIQMHLACYNKRSDIFAVVHAHPPMAIVLTLSGISLTTCILPEVVLTLGRIPTVPYATTGSIDLALAVGDCAESHNAMLLERHGAVCLGFDLIDAYSTMEKLEHTATIVYHTSLLGGISFIGSDEVERLRTMGKKYSKSNEMPPLCGT